MSTQKQADIPDTRMNQMETDIASLKSMMTAFLLQQQASMQKDHSIAGEASNPQASMSKKIPEQSAAKSASRKRSLAFSGSGDGKFLLSDCETISCNVIDLNFVPCMN